MTETLAPRRRKVKILATLGPASSDARMIRRLMLAGADAFRINMSHGDQKQKAKLVDAHPRAREGVRAADDDPVRPSGAQAAGRSFRRRPRRCSRRARASSSTATTRPATASASSCRMPSCSRRSGPATSILIDDGKVRLNVLEADDGQIVTEVKVGGDGVGQQGRQRPRRGGADPGADRKGPRRPQLRARAAGRLDRFVVRPAARGCRRSAVADRRARGAAGQDREAGGDRPLERHHRAGRRGDGRARRPRRRASARAGAAAAEQDRRLRAPVRQAGGGRDADARIDDHLADPDARRGQRRRDRDLRRRRCGDAVGGKRGRPISVRGGADDGPHRDQRRARSDLPGAGSTSPRRGSSRPPPMRSPVRRGRSPAPSRRPRWSATPARARLRGGSRANGRRCRCWR